MVDVIAFQENKPNCPCPRAQRVQKVRPRYSVFGACKTIKPANVDPDQLKEDELLICSPTVLGFCLGSKTFRSCPLSMTAVFGPITGLMYRVTLHDVNYRFRAAEQCPAKASASANRHSGTLLLQVGPFGSVGNALSRGRCQWHRPYCCRVQDVTYNFNSSSHEVASHCDRLVLAKPRNSSNCLTFDAWVPLRLEDVYVVCCREIEPCKSQSETRNRDISGIQTRMRPRQCS